MKEKYSSIYEKYCIENTQPKRKIIKRRKKFSLQHLLSLSFCFMLLFFVFPHSFRTYITDIFHTNKTKNFHIDYKELMYPAHSMLPNEELVLGNYTINNINYTKPLMLDIPESFQRIGLKNSLLALAERYKRLHASIYVWEYNGGSYVDINANESFPAASIIKLPVLVEMFRAIENQKFSLYDTMVFEDYYRADGSGKLKYSKDGIPHTLDHLARIMIENSDNSSTNMIMSKIGGMPLVNNAMKNWGLRTTSVHNWLPDLGGTNVTTAREMAKILYNVDATNILTTESKKHIADYMVNVKNTRLLKAGLPDNAIILHKTGDIGFMLGDAGIVKSANGKKYIVVIMVKRPYNNMQGKEFIVQASRLIYNHIAN